MKTGGNERPALLLESREELNDLKDAVCLLMESARKGVDFWSRMVKEKGLSPERLKMREQALEAKRSQLNRSEAIMAALKEYDDIEIQPAERN